MNGKSVLFLFSILMHLNDAMRNAMKDAIEAKAEKRPGLFKVSVNDRSSN